MNTFQLFALMFSAAWFLALMAIIAVVAIEEWQACKTHPDHFGLIFAKKNGKFVFPWNAL